jgi:hypothetical protein
VISLQFSIPPNGDSGCRRDGKRAARRRSPARGLARRAIREARGAGWDAARGSRPAADVAREVRAHPRRQAGRAVAQARRSRMRSSRASLRTAWESRGRWRRGAAASGRGAGERESGKGRAAPKMWRRLPDARDAKGREVMLELDAFDATERPGWHEGRGHRAGWTRVGRCHAW